MRELVLRVTNDKGIDFTEQEIRELESDKEAVKNNSGSDLQEVLERSKARGQVYDYRMMICQILEAPVPGGIDISSMRRISSILDAVEAASSPGSVLLEEEDWNYLKQKISSHKFPSYSKGSMCFVDHIINNTQKVDVAKAS